jgi:hypothetical protein
MASIIVEVARSWIFAVGPSASGNFVDFASMLVTPDGAPQTGARLPPPQGIGIYS